MVNPTYKSDRTSLPMASAIAVSKFLHLKERSPLSFSKSAIALLENIFSSDRNSDVGNITREGRLGGAKAIPNRRSSTILYNACECGVSQVKPHLQASDHTVGAYGIRPVSINNVIHRINYGDAAFPIITWWRSNSYFTKRTLQERSLS